MQGALDEHIFDAIFRMVTMQLHKHRVDGGLGVSSITIGTTSHPG